MITQILTIIPVRSRHEAVPSYTQRRINNNAEHTIPCYHFSPSHCSFCRLPPEYHHRWNSWHEQQIFRSWQAVENSTRWWCNCRKSWQRRPSSIDRRHRKVLLQIVETWEVDEDQLKLKENFTWWFQFRIFAASVSIFTAIETTKYFKFQLSDLWNKVGDWLLGRLWRLHANISTCRLRKGLRNGQEITSTS